MQGKEKTQIAIAGGGIGGALGALLLAKQGWSVQLFEARPKLDELSYGLQLTPNAASLLTDFGLRDPLLPSLSQPKQLEIYRASDGRCLRRLDLPTPYYTVSRQALMRELHAALKASQKVTIHLGKSITGVEIRDGRPCLGFKSGEHLTFDALVAAAGLHGDFLPAGFALPPTISTKSKAFRARISMRTGDHLTESVCLYFGEKGHALLYPIEAGNAINGVVIEKAPTEDQPDLAAAFPKDLCQGLDLEEAVWKSWPIQMKASGSWQAGHGPITLLGDMAHGTAPFLAQGAAMAFEDVAVLCRALEGAESFADAFRLYEAERQARCARVQRASRRQGQFYHPPNFVKPFRNLAVAIAPSFMIQQKTDWIFKHQP